MNGSALFDTNILVDYLRGHAVAADEIDRYGGCFISIITWMEVMAGTDPRSEAVTRSFLLRFRILDIESDVAERAALIRRSLRMKLPDAIIQASAETHGLLLVTRNTRDFDASSAGVRVPYTLAPPASS